MSTAVMPQSAIYDFGEMFKSIPGSQGSESSNAIGSHLAVGTPPLSPRIRFALSRMSSSPATANATATFVNSLLDNLSISSQHNNHNNNNNHHHHKRLERTQSAPAPAAAAAAAAAAASAAANSVSAAAAAAAAVNTSRYKTELCRPYEEFGVCKYGDKCQFAHGMAELRSLARHPKYKTELCRTYHTSGFCPYGPRCHFVHNEEEARQHNRAVAAMLALKNPNHIPNVSASLMGGGGRQQQQRPSALSPALSLDSPSPPSSLSQSPTSSMGSFFSSEPELHSPILQQQQHHHPSLEQTTTIITTGAAAVAAACPPSPSSDNPEFRLPVFNRLSAPVLGFGDLIV